MNVLAIFGSPRPDGNSARMLNEVLVELGEDAEIHRVHLASLIVAGCGPCRQCVETGLCVIDDDMQQIYDELRWADIIVIATPCQFSDVSSDVKKMMERTWCMKGELKNKIGGYVVSARRYIESAMNTLHAFMLRHQMILGGSGALGYTLTENGTIDNDPLAIPDSHKTGKRLRELYQLLHGCD
jgi:multimeric flavodoxin WrbA